MSYISYGNDPLSLMRCMSPLFLTGQVPSGGTSFIRIVNVYTTRHNNNTTTMNTHILFCLTLCALGFNLSSQSDSSVPIRWIAGLSRRLSCWTNRYPKEIDSFMPQLCRQQDIICRVARFACPCNSAH